MQTEGYVTSWSEAMSVVSMPDGKSSCLIMKTLDDVLSVQVFHDNSETKVGLREHMSNLEEQFQATYEMPSADDLRLKKLSDLKKLMVEQEKKIIKDKLVDHYATNNPTLTSQAVSKQDKLYKDQQYGFSILPTKQSSK
jgi:hypothetical protein